MPDEQDARRDDLAALRRKVRAFAEARDWDQFHSPKNLACALIVEAGELLEHFQWLDEDESYSLVEKKRQEVADELADVLIYLVRLAEKLDIDLADATFAKIDQNEKRYPVDKAKGTSKKYTELKE